MLILAFPAMTALGLQAQPCATPSNVTATPSVYCAGATVNLTAISTGNNIDWYDQPSGGTLLGTSASGANFAVTPSGTTTYYAEAVQNVGATQNFTYSGSIQNYTVPVGITSIVIDARGAQGGNTNGGNGARMVGTFAVTPGEVLGIVVGQQGIVNNCGGGGASGGGGGGTFVWRLSAPAMPMIAAGAGGGGNTNWSGGCIDGIDAVTTQDGTQGSGPTSAMGGTAGQGGFGNAPSGTGSGGAGWLSAGQNSTWGSGCTGGLGPFTFTGGNGASAFGPGGEGGYGGGGGAVCGCGGGGGYSGGGGGEGSSCRAGGGGGGSYNAGTSQSNTAGVQLGNGLVTIATTGLPCTNSPRIAVTVTLDNIAPTAVCQADTVMLDSLGNGTALAAAINNGSTDNCTIASTTLSPNSFTCANAGSNTVTLTVTDANGNSSTCTTTVMVIAPEVEMELSADTTTCGFNVSCAAGNDGTATAVGVGGCPSYSFLWSNGQTTATATGLSAGTHTVTITDGAGNTDVDTLVLNAPTALSIGWFAASTCVGDSTGSIDLSVSGGNDCQGYSFLWSNGATSEDLANLGSGTYTVTVTDVSGCTATSVVTVAAFSVPNPTITQAGNTLSAGQTWVTYQWLLNGSNISGATANTYTATQSGSYSLMVTDSNGCSAVSTPLTLTIVGITNALGDGLDLTLYPNPNHGTFRLQTASPVTCGIVIRIHDRVGRNIFEKALPGLEDGTFIELQDVAAGTYMVEVRTELGHQRMFKLVIE
jgi:hypothetical protein